MNMSEESAIHSVTWQNIFGLFAIDTIKHCLRSKGMSYPDDNCDEHFNNVPKRFTPNWGQAVLNYRECYEENFYQLLTEYPKKETIFEDDLTIERYMSITAVKATRGDSFCMDILRYFAFCADLAIRCHISGNRDLIPFVVEFMDYLEVDTHKKAFTIVGGYHSLNRLGDQFVEYKRMREEYRKRHMKDIMLIERDSKPVVEKNEKIKEIENFKPVELDKDEQVKNVLNDLLEAVSAKASSISLTQKLCGSLYHEVSRKFAKRSPSGNLCEIVLSGKTSKTKTERTQNLPQNSKILDEAQKSKIIEEIVSTFRRKRHFDGQKTKTEGTEIKNTKDADAAKISYEDLSFSDVSVDVHINEKIDQSAEKSASSTSKKFKK